MTTFLRHVSTIYANLTALYSIGQSVQVIIHYTVYQLRKKQAWRKIKIVEMFPQNQD